MRMGKATSYAYWTIWDRMWLALSSKLEKNICVIRLRYLHRGLCQRGAIFGTGICTGIAFIIEGDKDLFTLVC